MKKSEKDIHVLNWGKITESNLTKHMQVNTNTTNDSISNKGILFEDIVEKLLLSMFPEETWKRTKESYDGKRDFVYPAEEYLSEQKWAECKNYTNNLSINIIAPTLIMGAINNIKSIFFFSYSPLNDTAIENLFHFSEMEKSDVRIYDGNFLENLICTYHTQNGIEDFFPNTDFKKAHEELDMKQFRVIKALYDLNGNKISSTHRFELGESFYIRIMIQNLTMKVLNYEISFYAQNPKILYSQTTKSMGQLPPERIESYSILCETLSSGRTNYAIQININGNIKKITQKITVIDEPYLAWIGKNALTAWKEARQHFFEKNIQPLCIEGESGTGKSTLLEILLQDKKIQKSYRILKIDLTLARNNCVRDLFSQIFGMYGKEESPEEQIKDSENALSILINNYAESADMIAHTIMTFYDPHHPYLFIVDDIQKINRPYISLFQKIDNLAHEMKCVIFYLFALNKEELSFPKLCTQLNWDIPGQKRECKTIKTTKFNREDIIAYMKTRYGLDELEQYLDDFEKEISPLELHSFCSGLKKERIIVQIPGRKKYQIVDRFKFADGIRQVLFAETITKKIDNLLDKGSYEEFLLKYLYIADVFNQDISSKYTYVIQDLIDQGILRDKGDTITFYHDKIKKETGKKLKFTEEDYADIFDDKNANNITKAICALEQIGHLRGGNAFLEYFFSLSNIIEKGEQRYQICKKIFQHLDELNQAGLSSVALQFVSQQFNLLRDEQGHDTFIEFLNIIANSALTNTWDTDERTTEIMAFFIKKFFDRSLSTYNHQRCIDYFKKYEKIFNSLNNMSIERRNFWLSHYANRAAIALDRESLPLKPEPEPVTELYKTSESYSEQADNYDQLILQITIDNFNRHYVYRHDLTPNHIKLFYEKLLELKKKEMSNSIILDYHLLLMEYLQNQPKVFDEKDFLNRL